MRIRAFIFDSEHAAGVCLGTCSANTCVPTVDAESPAQVAAYHATRVRRYQVITYLHVGLVILLIPLLALLLATTLVMSWRNSVVLEQK